MPFFSMEDGHNPDETMGRSGLSTDEKSMGVRAVASVVGDITDSSAAEDTSCSRNSQSTLDNEQSTCRAENALQLPAHSKLLLEPHIRDIWEELATYIVHRKTWKVDSFDSFTSLDAYSEDVHHYPAEDQRIHMKQRRDSALKQRTNPERWSRLALDAFKELATNSPGSAVAILDKSGFRAVFNDFAVHTRYFQLTKNLTESAGIKVFVAGLISSSIHDIDKLDPIMLAGYGERWEDTKHTALWRACVESHFSLNTHHQQNKLWHLEESHDKCVRSVDASSSIHDIDKLDPIMLAGYGERWEDTKHTSLWRVCVKSHFSLNTHHQQNKLWHLEESHDKDIECCMKALPELLCDKASRKLQKELDSVVSPAMWDVDKRFYLGMPQVWLDQVTRMAKQLAEGRPSGKPKLTAT